MRTPARCGSAALALALAALAGCGSAASPAQGPAPEAAAAGAPFLTTSMVTAAGTWAVVVMGGSAATHNNFWQLFVRPTGSTGWKLVTPPGVPDNGGLVVADAGGRSVITGFRPSQYLTYTPLTATRDGGQAWSPTGPLDGALADAPDALTAAPGTGHLLALLTSGAVELATPGYTRWQRLVSERALGAAPAGRACGLREVTAAVFTPSGRPLLAGACSHPGVVGIFTAGSGTWQASGPRLPTGLARQAVTVLRLTRTANRTVALLRAGTGKTASLLAAWSAGNGGHWALSPPLRLGGAKVSSAAFGPTGACTIVLNGTRADTISGAGTGPGGAADWRSLPPLPTGTATVAPGPAGGFDALAVHRTKLTVWQLGPGGAPWRTTQVVNAPIQFGSSG
jgi:hypothetical protein